MGITEIEASTSQKYDKFVESHPLGNVHQLYEWAVFQSKSAKRDKFYALASQKKGLLVSHYENSALIIRQKLPFGLCWLYCPAGPLIDYAKNDENLLLIDHIRQIARREKAVFLRFDPPVPTGDKDLCDTADKFFAAVKARPAHAHYMPENTLINDLEAAEEEILKQMKPKGRYNIKVAQKHGVKVEIRPSDDVEIFTGLFAQTTERDRFSGHPASYYKNMLETLGEKRAKLWVAYYEDKPLASAIVTYFKDTATYYFGASSNEHRNTMAPYLLHWEIMRDAKSNGYKHYDLFGIAPDLPDKQGEIDKSHPWASVSEFKLKFGGRKVDYLPAREIIYKPFWYAVIKLMKRIKGL